MSARITDCKPQVYRTHRPRCRLNDTTGASEWLRPYVAPLFANLSTQDSLNSATLLTVILAPETAPPP
jgi:hypothetical protein